VHSAGELRQFGTCIRRLSGYREPTRYSAKLASLGANVDCEKLGKAYMRTTEKLRGTLPRFVDKLPPNYLYLPLILKALPKAKIIHLTRNPMDACFARDEKPSSSRISAPALTMPAILSAPFRVTSSDVIRFAILSFTMRPRSARLPPCQRHRWRHSHRHRLMRLSWQSIYVRSARRRRGAAPCTD